MRIKFETRVEMFVQPTAIAEALSTKCVCDCSDVSLRVNLSFGLDETSQINYRARADNASLSSTSSLSNFHSFLPIAMAIKRCITPNESEWTKRRGVPSRIRNYSPFSNSSEVYDSPQHNGSYAYECFPPPNIQKNHSIVFLTWKLLNDMSGRERTVISLSVRHPSVLPWHLMNDQALSVANILGGLSSFSREHFLTTFLNDLIIVVEW